jgi:hypothetical protein
MFVNIFLYFITHCILTIFIVGISAKIASCLLSLACPFVYPHDTS